jgi:hypothetical protein
MAGEGWFADVPDLTLHPRLRRSGMLALWSIATFLVILPATLSAGENPHYYDVDSNKWSCDAAYGSAKYPYRVRAINVSNDTAAVVFLKKGCTGWVDLTVATVSQDMVKLQDGAKKLTVTGSLACAGKKNTSHQDGVQATGGKNVTLSLMIDCPTINNGGVWISTGANGNATPTGVVCDQCDILPVGNNAVHVGSSDSSGVQNSKLFEGSGAAAPDDCVRINNDAGHDGIPTNPVNVNNSCLPIPPDPVSSVSEPTGKGMLAH